MNVLHIAPTSFPTNLGTGGAEKVALEFDQIMHDQVELFTIAHPETDVSYFKGPVTAQSLHSRNREHVLSIIKELNFDKAIVHMTRTKELKLALELDIPFAVIVHIAPEISGMMLYEWMELMAKLFQRKVPVYAVSKPHAKRLEKAYLSARAYLAKQQAIPLVILEQEPCFDKYIHTHFASDELTKDIFPGDKTFCTVSRISAAGPIDRFFAFDKFHIPLKLITNRSNIISQKDEAAYEKYHDRFGFCFKVDLKREEVLHELRMSSALVNPLVIDSSPCKVFEANALGVPAIFFDKDNTSGATDLQVTDYYAKIELSRNQSEMRQGFTDAINKIYNITWKDRIELANKTREHFTKQKLIDSYFNILNSLE